MRAQARERLHKAKVWLRRIFGLASVFVPDDRAREGLRRAGDALDALDPNEKALRDEYGVPPDIR